MAWNIDADLKKIGARLKRIRIARDLAIDTVAKEVRMPPLQLQQLEEGACPDCKLNVIFKLMEFYGVSGEEIFGKGRK
jgi:transcriptional regulator with XRE-family HTH domain